MCYTRRNTTTRHRKLDEEWDLNERKNVASRAQHGKSLVDHAFQVSPLISCFSIYLFSIRHLLLLLLYIKNHVYSTVSKMEFERAKNETFRSQDGKPLRVSVPRYFSRLSIQERKFQEKDNRINYQPILTDSRRRSLYKH